MIGASANAAMIYALGYAACLFYEAKINPLTSQTALAASPAESDKYLEPAIAQEVVMDQIWVHIWEVRSLLEVRLKKQVRQITFPSLTY